MSRHASSDRAPHASFRIWLAAAFALAAASVRRTSRAMAVRPRGSQTMGLPGAAMAPAATAAPPPLSLASESWRDFLSISSENVVRAPHPSARTPRMRAVLTGAGRRRAASRRRRARSLGR